MCNRSSKPAVMKWAVRAPPRSRRALVTAGGGKAHRNRRQRAAERRPGDQAGGEQGRLFARPQLDRAPRLQRFRNGTGQPNHPRRRIVFLDRDAARFAQRRELYTVQESVWQRRPATQPKPILLDYFDPIPQGAARQHLAAT